MRLRTRLIGATLLTAALLSIGEQLWAATCAPEGVMAGVDHSAMPGMEDMPDMPDMAAMADHTGRPAHSQPSDNRSTDCPLADALVQACGWHMLTPNALTVLSSVADHREHNTPATTLTPETADRSSVFHPPKL